MSDDVKSDPINLARWIKRGRTMPTKSVTVYLAAGLEEEIRDIDNRLAKPDGMSEQDQRDLAAQREEMAAEMADSKIKFRFRGLRPGEQDEIRAEAGEAAENVEIMFRVFARQCVEPAGLTWESFRDLNEALGDGYFGDLIETAMSAARGVKVDIPFSLIPSALLRTEVSSAS